MRYLSAFLVVACSSDPGAPPINAEPAPTVTAQATQAAVDGGAPAPDAAPTATGTPPDLLEAPPDPAPAAPPAPTSTAPAGFHEAASGACYLPNVLKAGECKCAVYDSRGRVLEPGNLCFDSCAYNADGVAEYHSFCVDGGLPADRVLP